MIGMIEIAERSYRSLIGSDLQREGMFLEVRNASDDAEVAEVFYSDADDRMSFTASRDEVPVELIEWMIATARGRLTR